ncbi:MAG: hypothetical protein EOP88_00770 [Verrucomicrobiaceae bacterium]|nr:MAG: hypothetical protein EOP88_00770 [Verrucomicrobiaceae bacterium]
MKHKSSLKLLLAGALALSPGLLHATDDFARGELSLVFYSLTGDAPGVLGSDYYVVNLGPVASFRANTQNNVSVKTVNPTIASSNVAADLQQVFGAGWAEDGTVRMMAVTTIPQDPNVPVSGDPAKTIYYSAARTSLDSGQKGFDANSAFLAYQGNPNGATVGSGTRTQSSNDITNFIYVATNGTIANNNPPSGVNTSGVRLTTSQPNNLSIYVPPASGGLYFKQGTDPTAVLGEGKLPGSANVEAAVDIFRVLHTTTGATLTSGSSSGNAVTGQGQFIGSITLDSTGELKVQAVGVSTPPAGGYSTWATANNVTGGPTGDSDNDGISNLAEYALALNPAGSDGAAGTFAAGTITFTKRAEAVTNNDVTYAIQESDDLGVADAWEIVTPTTDTPSSITYTLPVGSTKKFARLIVRPVVAP